MPTEGLQAASSLTTTRTFVTFLHPWRPMNEGPKLSGSMPLLPHLADALYKDMES